MGKKRIVCALKDGEKQILGFRLPLRLATVCAAKLHTLRIVAFAVSGCLIGKKITLWERRPKSYTGLNQTKGFTKGYMMKLFMKFLARWTGLEPATTGVTGRYSNQLSYHRA